MPETGTRGRHGAVQTWSARACVQAQPREVLDALTDPELIAAWAPVSFELEGRCGRRLRGGCRERVSGSIAGLRASFDIEVTRAEPQALELVAEGQLEMDVAYAITEARGGVLVDASVAVRPAGGLRAQVLRGAVAALLNAGVLDRALERLAATLCERPERERLAAMLCERPERELLAA